MMKTTIILAFLLTLTACTSGLSPEEIETRVVEANTGIDTYTLTSQVSMVTEAAEKSLAMDISMDGEIDRANKIGHIVSNTKIAVAGFPADITQETFVTEDKLYSEAMGEWFILEVEGMWEEQDQVQEYTDLLKSGDLKVKGTERLEGAEYYIVEMTLTEEYLNEYMGASISDEELGLVDFSDYHITFYVNTETFVIERNTGKLSITQNIGGESITMNLDINTVISDINQPLNIVIPEEALNAEVLSDDLIGGY